jgi:hypothetical protein
MGENLTDRSRVFGVVDLGSGWNLDFQVAARTSRLVGSLAVSTSLGRVNRAKTEVVEGIQAFVAYQNHVAAMAAIAARGTSSGNVLLPTKGRTAIASTSGADMNHGFV